MKTVVLISCVSQKQDRRVAARDLYTSPLFRYNLQYAQSLRPDAIYILSAKHGLLDLDQMVSPYDVAINDMKAPEIRAWAEKVRGQLARKADLQNDRFIFLAGHKYRKYLQPYLNQWEAPLEGLSIGRQLQFLKGQVGG